MATEISKSEEAATSDRVTDRWLAVSEPLAVDDDPDWQILEVDTWRDETRIRPSTARTARLTG